MVPGGPGRLTGLSRGVLVWFSLTWGSGGGGESWGEPSWSLGFLGTLHWFPGQGEQLVFPRELVRPALRGQLPPSLCPKLSFQRLLLCAENMLLLSKQLHKGRAPGHVRHEVQWPLQGPRGPGGR